VKFRTIFSNFPILLHTPIHFFMFQLQKESRTPEEERTKTMSLVRAYCVVKSYRRNIKSQIAALKKANRRAQGREQTSRAEDSCL